MPPPVGLAPRWMIGAPLRVDRSDEDDAALAPEGQGEAGAIGGSLGRAACN